MKIQTKDRVLKVLYERRGMFVSGEELAKALALSRNAVWKSIVKLKEEGYEIEAVSRNGYKLVGGNDMINAPAIYAFLSSPLKDELNIEVIDETTSTNTALKKAAQEGAADKTVLIARKQSGGRGRLGRSFFSPGKGLYISILLRPDSIGTDDTLSLTTTSAVAVARVAERCNGIKTDIKWVNDVYQNGKKICGILTEAAMDLESRMLEYIICGIGINIKEPPGGFPAEIRDRAGALFAEEDDPDCNHIAAILLEEFFSAVNCPRERVISEYRNRSFLIGKSVVLYSPADLGGRGETVTVTGIDEQLRLIVKDKTDTERIVSSGDVSLHIESGPTTPIK